MLEAIIINSELPLRALLPHDHKLNMELYCILFVIGLSKADNSLLDIIMMSFLKRKEGVI